MLVTRFLPLGSMVFANLLVSVLVQWFVMGTLGAGTETDALFASLMLPQLVLLVTSGPAVRVIVPLLSAGQDEARRRQDTWTFLHVGGAAAAALAVALAATAPLWVPLLFPGFDSATRHLTVELSRIQLLGVVFSALVTILAAFHHSRDGFLRVEIALLVSAVAGFAAIVTMLPVWGVAGVAWVTVGRMALQTAMMLPGLGPYRRPSIRDKSVTELRRRMTPLLLGAAYYKNERLVDRFLSSMAPAGNLSLMVFGYQAYTAVAQLLNRWITAPLLPQLTRLAESGSVGAFRVTYRRGMLVMLAMTGVSYLVFLAAGEQLLYALFREGRMTDADVYELWLLMTALGGYLVAGGCGQVVSAAYYARGDTWTPMKVGIATFTIGIPLRAAGFWMYGVAGIALGASAYHVLNAATLLVLLERGASSAQGRAAASPVTNRAAIQ